MTYSTACLLFLPIYENPEILASKIYHAALKENISNIYLAAPPQEYEFMIIFHKYLERRKINVFHGNMLTEFINERYGNCEYFQIHSDDLISVFEQEVCYRNRLNYT
jgi:hypothetical protein